VSFHDVPEELKHRAGGHAAGRRTAEPAAWLTGRAAETPVLGAWL
jgi:hypothetical protein